MEILMVQTIIPLITVLHDKPVHQGESLFFLQELFSLNIASKDTPTINQTSQESSYFIHSPFFLPLCLPVMH